jgi:hypothetical protein
MVTRFVQKSLKKYVLFNIQLVFIAVFANVFVIPSDASQIIQFDRIFCILFLSDVCRFYKFSFNLIAMEEMNFQSE